MRMGSRFDYCPGLTTCEHCEKELLVGDIHLHWLSCKARLSGESRRREKELGGPGWGPFAVVVLAAMTLLLSGSASGGHLTEIHGERAVTFGGRTWTWEQLQERRAEAPGRFDANHPVLGWALRNPDAATARRDLDPERFDRYHPYLGWLLGGLDVAPPITPPVIPPEPSLPIHAVPEPSSLATVLIALGLGTAWIWTSIFMRWWRREPEEEDKE